jgi:hypothetical protein
MPASVRSEKLWAMMAYIGGYKGENHFYPKKNRQFRLLFAQCYER